jgi:hypothetical protein
VQGFVDARFAHGSDYLRIIYDHFLPTLSAEQLHALVVAAHKRNRLVVAHEGTQSEGHRTSGTDSREPRSKIVAFRIFWPVAKLERHVTILGREPAPTLQRNHPEQVGEAIHDDHSCFHLRRP